MIGKQLNYGWRVVATGFCFFCFGVGGMLLSLFFFPLLVILPARTDFRKCLAKQIVHYTFRFFVGMMQFVGVLNLKVVDADKLKESGQLIVANHPTLIDVVVLVSLLAEADCIVKHALWRNIFLRGVVSSTGYISNSQPEQLISDCVECLKRGHTLITFRGYTHSSWAASKISAWSGQYCVACEQGDQTGYNPLSAADTEQR